MGSRMILPEVTPGTGMTAGAATPGSRRPPPGRSRVPAPATRPLPGPGARHPAVVEPMGQL
jgi:hypothetical protein